MAIAADCKSADFKSTLVRVRSRLNDFGIIAPEMDYPDELSEYLGRKIWKTKYLDNDGKPNADFFEMVNEYEKRLDYAHANTSLPDNPDYKRINEFVMSVNERIVKGEI